MRPGRARLAGLALAPVLAVWAVVLAAGGARADDERLFRASAEANAVHGFYDHRDLVPVPLFDLAVPHAEASLEPGPATAALGSFLWEPQAAELSTIVCQLSNGEMCDLPEYPFVARASSPRSGEQSEPPTLELGDPAPLSVRGADEHAAATPAGAASDATVQSFGAIPMDAQQTAAARGLWLAIAAAGLGSGGGPAPDVPGLPGGGAASPSPSPGGSDAGGGPTPWLVSIGNATSSASVTNRVASAGSSAWSTVHGLALLGSAIVVEAVHGEASATAAAGEPNGAAGARWAGLSVGGVPATIGPDGIQIQDQSLGGDQIQALQDAANQALAQAGLGLSLGSHTVTRQDGTLVAEAWALSLDAEEQIVPPGAPQGAGGQDVLHVPLGYARATVESVTFPGPPEISPPGGTTGPVQPTSGGGSTSAPPPPAPPTTGGSGPGLPPGGGLAPPPPPPATPGDLGNAPARRHTRRGALSVVPARGSLSRGIPAASFALLGLSGIAFVVGMTGLKTIESLTETEGEPR